MGQGKPCSFLFIAKTYIYDIIISNKQNGSEFDVKKQNSIC